jgi:SAM-dependent methyltransferase
MNTDRAEPEQSRSVEQHLREILRNRKAWENKPVLQKIYGSFYQEIAACLTEPLEGLVLEVGSGIGVAKRFIPNCVTSDIYANPWLDRVENAYGLRFNDSSIRNLILFDVFHHLKYPGSALAEFRRVVTPKGRVIIFEPAMGALGKLVYGLFHHEPLALNSRIDFFPPQERQSTEHGYYAAQGNAWRIFVNGEYPALFDGWNLLSRRTFCALSYVLSGGFSRPCLYPHFLLPAVRKIDRLLEVFPSLFGTRLLVVLEKTE